MAKGKDNKEKKGLGKKIGEFLTGQKEPVVAETETIVAEPEVVAEVEVIAEPVIAEEKMEELIATENEVIAEPEPAVVEEPITAEEKVEILEEAVAEIVAEEIVLQEGDEPQGIVEVVPAPVAHIPSAHELRRNPFSPNH